MIYKVVEPGAHVCDDTVADMRDEPQQVGAVDGGITEAFSAPVPVRVKAAAADLHHLAGPALLGQGVDADLPGDRRGMVQRVVEAAGGDVQAGVGGAGIGGAERVELLDGAIGVDHDERCSAAAPVLLPRLAGRAQAG